MMMKRIVFTIWLAIFSYGTALAEPDSGAAQGGDESVENAPALAGDPPIALKIVRANKGFDAFQGPPPTLAPLRKGDRETRRLFMLTADYPYLYEPTCELILVPKNFVTDLASIPAAARIRFNPQNYAEPALVHDWLYAVGLAGGRRKADEVFKALMIETNVKPSEANVIYRAVRAGGGSGYGLEEDFSFYDADEGVIRKSDARPETPYSPGDCAP